MRSQTAIALVVLGGGITTMAVSFPRHCTDPLTDQSIACPSRFGSSFGGHGSGGGGGISGGGSSGVQGLGTVARGGFGAAGHGFSAGS